MYSLGKLDTLQLEACRISDPHLDQLLEDIPSTLKYLGLINLDITLEGKSQRKKHSLTEMLNRKSSKIETLSLNCNRIGIKGCLALAQGLCYNHSVKILDLSRNLIGAKGCYLLSEAICSSCSQIQSLDLSYNGIGNEGAKCMS